VYMVGFVRFGTRGTRTSKNKFDFRMARKLVLEMYDFQIKSIEKASENE
jgi:hypothetical protein